MFQIAFTNAGIAMGFISFWVVLLTLTGLVAGNIALSVSEGDVRGAIDQVQSESGFFAVVFVWVANTILDTIGFEGLAIVALGFGSLPEWLNFVLFAPLIFFTIYAIVVSLLPTGS